MTNEPVFGTQGVLRLLRSIVGLGGAAIMAHAVDKGITSAWSSWLQGAWFLAMIGLGSFGLGPVFRYFGYDRRLVWLPLLYCVWLALVFPIAWQLHLRLSIPYLSTYIIAFALTMSYGAWRKTWWWWKVPDEWVSAVFGDRVAQVLYIAFALFLIVVAIMYDGE